MRRDGEALPDVYFFASAPLRDDKTERGPMWVSCLSKGQFEFYPARITPPTE